jgi:hypothetical protein
MVGREEDIRILGKDIRLESSDQAALLRSPILQVGRIAVDFWIRLEKCFRRTTRIIDTKRVGRFIVNSNCSLSVNLGRKPAILALPKKVLRHSYILLLTRGTKIARVSLKMIL